MWLLIHALKGCYIEHIWSYIQNNACNYLLMPAQLKVETVAKWSTLCKQHFQKHFHETEVLNSDLNFTDVYS